MRTEEEEQRYLSLSNSEKELQLAISIFQEQNRNNNHDHQVIFREVVSICYYSVFHALTIEGSQFIFQLDVTQKPHGNLYHLIPRFFEHGTMKEACEKIVEFCKNNGQRKIDSKPKIGRFFNDIKPPDNIEELAKIFVRLQSMRKQADYDFSRKFTSQEVESIIGDSLFALMLWENVKKTNFGLPFVLALLHFKNIHS